MVCPAAAAIESACADGEAVSEAPVPAPSLSLRLTVLSGDEGSPSAVTTLTEPSTPPLDSLDESVGPAARVLHGGPVSLSLDEGVARPLTLLIELCEGEDGVAGGAEGAADGAAEMRVVSSAQVALDGSIVPSLAGEVCRLPLLGGADEAAAAAAAADGTAGTHTSLSYSLSEAAAPIDDGAAVSPATEETLSALLPEPLQAGAALPTLAGVCVRELWVEPSPCAEDAEPTPPPPPAKGKGKAAEPEPEPEPAGPTLELYPVSSESGRHFAATLRLAEEDAARVREEAAAAAEQAAAAWEEEAAAAEAQAIAHAEATAAADDAAEAQAAAEAAEVAKAAKAAGPPPAPPPPTVEWELGTVLTTWGALLVRGLVVPEDVPSAAATLVIAETTPPLALFALPAAPAVELPLQLLAKPVEGEAPPPPPEEKPKKGKK